MEGLATEKEKGGSVYIIEKRGEIDRKEWKERNKAGHWLSDSSFCLDGWITHPIIHRPNSTTKFWVPLLQRRRFRPWDLK